MPIDDEKAKQCKLVELVREAVERDAVLRKKYKIGQKFRFVQDRLCTLLEQLEKSLPVMTQREQVSAEIEADEVPVYVYLYNAQGTILRNWQTMLTPKVFYEYSVNRPIYAEKSDIEALLRSKSNKLHHAYLTVAVKSADIISRDSKDTGGNRVIKVKEGVLYFKKLIAFTHNEQDYVLNAQGEFVKKES